MQARRAQIRPSTPAELARRLLPGYRSTPTIETISDVLADAISQPNRRVIISCPPRTGKSVITSQIGVLSALARNPDARVVLTSYADSLAEEHSREARALIAEHSELLGFALRSDKTAVGRWRVEGHEGGLLAAGILSGITGFGADLLIVDDPIKNQQEADSAAHRRRIENEFRATLMTRLHPGASVVLIQTRWTADDLAGTLLADEPELWQHVNIPAVAEHGIPDALDRKPGVAMVSALGRTSEEFTAIRKSVGERVWHSLFQGVPRPPAGGLVHAAWFDSWRLSAPPARPVYAVVGVDPSDSGRGDACGLVAASVDSDGVVAVLKDRSRPMTSEAWARAAVDLALEVGASEIAIEGFASRETYTRVVRDALRRAEVARHINVTSWPPRGSGRGGGDSVARSAGLLQALEVGTCRVVGNLAALEKSAVDWLIGKHQPDALAALVVAFDVLSHAAGQQGMTLANPFRSMEGSRGATVTPLDEALSRRRRFA
jgi:hypothetical protein